MPRAARKQSITGIYHVILRGNNRQQVFEETDDYQKFLYVLSDYKKNCNFKLYAYALMGNHIHLLIEEGYDPLSTIIQKITTRFVFWYNRKYERIGHLFQGRFKSEPVENDRYFLAVIRYIHLNPVKSGLANRPEIYPWSSCASYLYKNNSLVNTSKLRMLLGTQTNLLDFFNTYPEDKCLDLPESSLSSDNYARRVIFHISKCNNVSQFQALDKKLQNDYIREIKKYGFSVRQISRLCGVSRYSVSKIE